MIKFAAKIKVMINNISFNTRNQSQTEIQIQHATGETTTILFNSIYPMQAKDAYIKSIQELDKMNDGISPKDELLGLFSWWFAKCSLTMPLAVATFRNNERKRIGEQIKKIREMKNIEARQLALMTGIDASNICRIEQGKHSVGIDILSKIANALGYRIELTKL